MNYESCRNNILLLCCRSSNRRLIGKIGLKSCSLALVWCGQAQLDPMLRDRVAGRAWHFLDGMDFGLHCGGKPKSHKQPGDTTSPGISCLSEIKKKERNRKPICQTMAITKWTPTWIGPIHQSKLLKLRVIMEAKLNLSLCSFKLLYVCPRRIYNCTAHLEKFTPLNFSSSAF